MLYNKLKPVIILIIVIVAALSCGDSGTDSNNGDFSGITVTNEVGDIISIDTDDWGCSDTIYQPKSNIRPQDIVPTVFCFGPAYPNPSTGPVNISIEVPVVTSTRVWLTDGRDFTVELLNDTLEAGVYDIVWDGSGAGPGIYRAFIETDFWQCHGDISLQ